MSGSQRILVRGVNWLGDAVMTTPALQRLREAKPDAHITLLTHEKLADLWHGHPSIDATIGFNSGENVFSVARRLRSGQFDTAIVFPNSFRSALEVFLARIPERVGHACGGRSFLLTRSVPPRSNAVRMHKRSRREIDDRIARNVARETFPAGAHHTHDYLHLVGVLGASVVSLPPLLCVNDREVEAVRARWNLDASLPLFALNPGAEYGAAKRWPAEKFVAAAIQLHEQIRGGWLIVGGKGDRELACEIASRLGAAMGDAQIRNLAGETSLRELCAVLKACAFVLTNDTGPMHIAAAVGTPVIVPFGSTSPELTGPATAASRHQLLVGNVPCAPCFLRECPIDFRCMKSISAEAVVEAALTVLRTARAP